MNMPKPIKNLSNMEIDEISLVDKGANQHAMITIAKRAPEEDAMPEEQFELYNENGELLAQDKLSDGDIVFDDAGNAYEYTLDQVAEDEAREPEMVGKSAFFESQTTGQPAGQSDFAKSVMEELSKAFGDDDRDAVIAKALGRVGELEAMVSKSAEIAKAERDLRLTREYIAKASEYNLPVDPAELGPVLYRMAETMSYDDCSVIAKCLETAGTALFEEVGYIGGGDNADVMDQVYARATETIGKAAGAGDVMDVFDTNPQAYDEYLASQRGF
jgi:hypothetical protein